MTVAMLLAIASPGWAFEAFLGRFVGSATLVDASGAVQERDVTTRIERYGEGGFSVEWTSVIRVDGLRDVPGVRQVVRSLAFEPAGEGAYFLAAPDYDPFTVRDPLEPMAGDALAWAAVDDDVLDIFIFVIGEDGLTELQHHRRELTDAGLDLHYLGLVDAEITTEGRGRMVRVD